MTGAFYLAALLMADVPFYNAFRRAYGYAPIGGLALLWLFLVGPVVAGLVLGGLVAGVVRLGQMRRE